MCLCTRDSTALSPVDQEKMSERATSIKRLLSQEVYIIIFRDEEPLWKYGSCSAISAEYENSDQLIKTSLLEKISVIEQFHGDIYGGQMKSFRVNCETSRIFVNIIDDNHQIVIINRRSDQEMTDLEEPLDLDGRLRQECLGIAEAIHGLSQGHALATV